MRSIARLAVGVLCFCSVTSQASVFGVDHREDFHPNSRPWTAIGRVDLLPQGQAFDREGSASFCTGSLVGPRLVLTNAHCVLDRAKDIWFQPGAWDLVPPSRARRIKVGTWDPDHRRSEDWALLELDEPLGERVGWFEVLPRAAQQLTMLVAYAMDYKEGLVPAVDKRCHFEGVAKGDPYLLHDCDMNGGSSGGPMFWVEEQVPRIIAINAAHMSREHVSYEPAFSLDHANVAVAADQFYDTISALKTNWLARLPFPK